MAIITVLIFKYFFKWPLQNQIINNSKNLALATEYFKSYYKVAYEKNTYSGGTTGFIPFNIEFTLDGISGIKIYDKLVVDTSFLPHNYTETLEFIVTGISNTLKDGDWETVIKTTLIPKFEKTDIKIDSANFQFVKYTPEAPPIKIDNSNVSINITKIPGGVGNYITPAREGEIGDYIDMTLTLNSNTLKNQLP